MSPPMEDPALSLPPGKPFAQQRGHLLKGCIDAMRHDPLGFYTRTQREHGHYVRIHAVPGIHCFLLTHPAAIEHILYKGHKNYRKPDRFYRALSVLVGDGLFTSEGELWARQRRLIQPAFHGQSIVQLGPIISRAIEAFNEAHLARADQPVDIDRAMMTLGLRIASTTLFTTDISGDADTLGQAFRTAFTHIGRRMNSAQLLPDWLPTPANRRFARARAQLDERVNGLIHERRAATHRPADLLTMLLEARDEETGQGMSDRQLRDEVLTLLTAAHENLGAALTWSWYLLATHPTIQQDVYDEIDAQLAGRAPTMADLPRLPLTRAAFEESMRLFPPGWGELRESLQPEQIDGYDLPGRALIVLCQWVTHRHPDFWSDPESFHPARFMSGVARSHHRFAYFPFGGGPRVCIGMQLALMEGTMVLAGVLQRFSVEMVPGQTVVPDATFTLRPRDGLKVFLRPRRRG